MNRGKKTPQLQLISNWTRTLQKVRRPFSPLLGDCYTSDGVTLLLAGFVFGIKAVKKQGE